MYHLNFCDVPRKSVISDRFIPLRKNTNWQLKFNLLNEDSQNETESNLLKKYNGLEDSKGLYPALLKNEILGTKIYDLNTQNNFSKVVVSPTLSSNMFTYSSNIEPITFGSLSPYSIISHSSQRLLRLNSILDKYNISKYPCKILDAPELLDDFYLNLLDWSSSNVVCISLNSGIYLMSCDTKAVTLLCDVAPDSVSSLAWHDDGNTLAVGTESGTICLWDFETRTETRRLIGHNCRVNALSWNGDILSSGGNNFKIIHHDISIPSNVPIYKLYGHKGEICGLKWSHYKQYLASGGNDNNLYVWDTRSLKFIHKFSTHNGAIKAIAWSPHQSGILASGGGSQDKCIKIWNIQSGKQLRDVDTGSQVCNLTWSTHSNDFLSTHGVPSNDIKVWNYQRLTQVASLPAHNSRVLFLAAAPDGVSVATAGGEELRIWQVFSRNKNAKRKKSVLNLFNCIR